MKTFLVAHGAWSAGWSWKKMHPLMYAAGYRLITPTYTGLGERVHLANPSNDLETHIQDLLNVIKYEDLQEIVLVGHSYGGGLITEAGNDPHVAGLVYIAAHAPDKGESEADNGKRIPPAYKSLQKPANGFDYIDPAQFPADFAGDLPIQQATFMGNAQMPTADGVFHAVIQNPAWRTKPSWYMVAKADRIINPDLERMYAKRANSHTVEIEGASHSVFESHPKEVTKLIIEAAEQSGNKNQ